MHGRIFVAAGGLLLAAGCSDIAPRVTPAFISAAQRQDPLADAVALERGRTVFVNACANCHALPAPSATPAEQWPHLMVTMGRKSHLVASDQRDVLRYMFAVQAQPPASSVSSRDHGEQIP